MAGGAAITLHRKRAVAAQRLQYCQPATQCPCKSNSLRAFLYPPCMEGKVRCNLCDYFVLCCYRNTPYNYSHIIIIIIIIIIKLFKLQIRPPSLILLITTSQDRWIFPSQSWEVRNSEIIIIIIIIIIIVIVILRRKGELQVGHFGDSVLCDDISIFWRRFLCLDLEQGYPTRGMYELYVVARSRVFLLTYLITYLLNSSMQDSPPWEAYRSSASQEIPRILWNPKVHSSTCPCPEPDQSSPCPHIPLPEDPS